MGSKDYTDWSSKGHEAGMKIWKERSPSTLLSDMISRINHPGRHKRLLIHLHPGIVFKPFINKPRSSKHKALRRRVHLEFQHLCGNSGIVIRNVYRTAGIRKQQSPVLPAWCLLAQQLDGR